MKRYLIFGLALISLASCYVNVSQIEEINNRLSNHDARLASLSEQVMMIDFEINSQTQNQRTESSNPPASQHTTLLPQTNVSTTQTSSLNIISEVDVSRIYDEGTRQFERRDFSSAINSFRTITTQTTNRDFLANSHFFIGESFFNMGDFTASRNSFQTVLDQFPNSSKAIDSKVKIAMTHIRQNRPEQARIILETVRREHPNYAEMSVVEQNLRLTTR
ncbi:MAG: tetratricopeptide repeat protein [Candidatus Cloacimonetes bacterium]|nr:tetratricopeptide repeat protein [Candidatus Cloacimonadota bacterium]